MDRPTRHPWRGRTPVRAAFAVAVAAGMAATGAASGAERGATCLDAPGFAAIVQCVVERMPKKGVGHFVPPDAPAFAAWREVTGRMLGGECEAIVLPPSLAGAFSVRRVADPASGTAPCVLLEVGDDDGDGIVDRGWGTFAVAAAPVRELVFEVPHAWTDIDTEAQSAALFTALGARAFAMAGATRDAAPAASPCQADYQAADAAHDATNLLQAATRAIAEFVARRKEDVTVVQLHGLSADTCPTIDVFMSAGGPWPAAPGSPLARLRGALRAGHPQWRVNAPDDPPWCDYNGGSNVQGRLLNGVAPEAVCTTRADGPTGRFIHVEQKRACRAAADWVAAFAQAFPARPAFGIRRHLPAGAS